MPSKAVLRLAPGMILALGCLLLLKAGLQREMELRGPLARLPATMLGIPGSDQVIAEDEQRVAGMTEYLLRSFGPDSAARFSVYVGYYASQRQGKTIHSPKNCLPGSGWEPLAAREEEISAGGKHVTINRYELANHDRRALVFYWYQGRGRVAANEYRVKLNLLKDAALRGRTEEALVRVVVPLSGSVNDSTAESMAREVSGQIIPALAELLPT